MAFHIRLKRNNTLHTPLEVCYNLQANFESKTLHFTKLHTYKVPLISKFFKKLINSFIKKISKDCSNWCRKWDITSYLLTCHVYFWKIKSFWSEIQLELGAGFRSGVTDHKFNMLTESWYWFFSIIFYSSVLYFYNRVNSAIGRSIWTVPKAFSGVCSKWTNNVVD